MAKTRIPRGANSLAKGNVIPATADLLAEYAANPEVPSKPRTLDVLMMTPR